jgi:hypothetical protein
MLSEKFCCHTIRVRKKILKRVKWGVIHVEFVFNIANVITPHQAVGLPILPMSPALMRSVNSNANVVTKPKIAPVIDNIHYKILYTEQEISELQK